MPRVTRRPLAQTDILEIWDFIADDSVAAADRWVDSPRRAVPAAGNAADDGSSPPRAGARCAQFSCRTLRCFLPATRRRDRCRARAAWRARYRCDVQSGALTTLRHDPGYCSVARPRGPCCSCCYCCSRPCTGRWRARSIAGTARTARGRMCCAKSVTRSPMFSGYCRRVRFIPHRGEPVSTGLFRPTSGSTSDGRGETSPGG